MVAVGCRSVRQGRIDGGDCRQVVAPDAVPQHPQRVVEDGDGSCAVTNGGDVTGSLTCGPRNPDRPGKAQPSHARGKLVASRQRSSCGDCRQYACVAARLPTETHLMDVM